MCIQQSTQVRIDTGAKNTNYADGQQHFEGNFSIELQGIPSVWNLIGNWLVEDRVTPQSGEISPNGITVQNYTAISSDPRTGLWMDSAGFTIDPERPISINANVKALRRTETQKASTYKAIRVGPGIPTGPLNPAPVNRNPFPGWSAITQMTWPGAPPIASDSNPGGFVLMGADFTHSNNLQIIKGCLSGDTRVLTPHGYFKMEDIADLPSRTLTEYGIKDTKGMVYQGKKPYVRVRTKLHNDLKVTPDHKLRVLRGDGTLGWKQAQDLTDQDYLLCQRGHGGMIPTDRGKSTDYWFLVGNLYGDGHTTRGEVMWGVSGDEEELADCVRASLEREHIHHRYSEVFPDPEVSKQGIKANVDMLMFASSRRYFPDVPDYQPKGRWRESGLPESIWSAGEKQIGAFLNGLFSTDGTIEDDGQVHYYTKHRRMSQGVRHLLHLLGVVSRTRRVVQRTKLGISRMYCTCLVGSRSRKAFRDKIGFSVEWKQGRLEEFTREGRHECDKHMTLPYSNVLLSGLFTGKYCYNKKDKEERKISSSICTIKKGSMGLSETFLEKVLARAEKVGAKNLMYELLIQYRNQGWYFDRVDRVDSGYNDVEMYDVFESESHSFIASGVCAGNCTGSPNPAAMIQGTMAVEGTVRLWRDGPIPDPYTIPGQPFTATGASLTMNFGTQAPVPQILIRHILLTSEEFTIQGQNTPVPRTFGFAGLGDGLTPPMSLPNI